MVRVGPDGPLVHAYPSEMWLPTGQGRPPLTAEEQLAGAQVARSVDGGLAVVVSASPAEARFALVRGGDVVRAWLVRSTTSLGEVQLAEPYGDGLLVVVRLWDENHAQFRVLRLAPDGLADSFAVERAEWAETASLSRFRLHGSTLYQLRSDALRGRDRHVRDRRDEMRLRPKLLRFVPGLVAGLTLVLLAFGAPAGAYHTNFTARCNDYWFNISPDLRARDARNYAYVAAGEGYQWGGGCWNNNNADDSPGDPPGDPNTRGEGPDCSGFTFKAWHERAETGDPVVPLPLLASERPRPVHGGRLQVRRRRAEHDGREGEHDLHGRLRLDVPHRDDLLAQHGLQPGPDHRGEVRGLRNRGSGLGRTAVTPTTAASGGSTGVETARADSLTLPWMVELLFMMLILKLPILYLAGVCYWAIKAEPEPRPLEGARVRVPLVPGPSTPPRRRPPRPGSHGGPVRREERRARAAGARPAR